MKKKVLLIATIYPFFESFEINNIKKLLCKNHIVHIAANLTNTATGKLMTTPRLDALNIEKHPIECTRTPLSLQNIKALKKLEKLVEKEKYDFIECHTPIGGVFGRILGKKYKIPVIYTAHGFHFYKGAPLLNWLLYYPVEKFLAPYTNCLITINKEDFYFASNKLKAQKVVYIPGIGIDINKISAVHIDKRKKRIDLGVKKNQYLICSIGEINHNKNHELVIKALNKIKNIDFKYIICGDGTKKQELIALVNKYGMDGKVEFLGYRSDVIEILKSSDLFVFPSFREGLSVSLMEAISCNLACLVSDIRGNRDLVNSNDRIMFKPNDINDLTNKIIYIYKNQEFCKRTIIDNFENLKKFDVKVVNEEVEKIYNQF